MRAIHDALAAVTMVAPAPFAQPSQHPIPLQAERQVAPVLVRPPPPPPVVYPPPPAPMVTYALLPRHWALNGARWIWVPPETQLRPVVPATRVAGRYVLRDGAYVWVPTHYRYE